MENAGPGEAGPPSRSGRTEIENSARLVLTHSTDLPSTAIHIDRVVKYILPAVAGLHDDTHTTAALSPTESTSATRDVAVTYTRLEGPYGGTSYDAYSWNPLQSS